MILNTIISLCICISTITIYHTAIIIASSTVQPTWDILTEPSVFNGIASSLQNCFSYTPNATVCGYDDVIIDGSTGPTVPNLTSANDIRMFHTWQRQSSEDFLIVLGLVASSTISSIELYFLSYLTQRISLPSIQLFGVPYGYPFVPLYEATPINYTFSEDFIPRDNTTNKVMLLVLSNPGPYDSLRLQMSFTGVDNIDWFFLSEVNVCTATIHFQSPSDCERNVLESSSGTSTSVVLNCTVLGAGVFQWHWKQSNATLQNGGRYQITVADGTRTSKLNISQLRFTDAGNYTCEVRHQSQSSYQSRTQELVLPGEDGM